MILTVTLNPAVDITYTVERLARRSAVRVDQVHAQAGGKGVNVARALVCLGSRPRVTGLVGGPRGELIRKGLAELGVDDRMVAISGESRQTILVSDAAGETLELDEPGPAVDPREWGHFERSYPSMLEGISVVVLSGSLPPGVPTDAYFRLAGTAKRAGCRVVLDSAGPSLLAGMAAQPDVVTPNRAELFDAMGTTHQSGVRAAVAAAQALRSLGAGVVVVSLGPAGAVAVTGEGVWRARHPTLRGNPTGAGDVLAAALAEAMEASTPWPEAVRAATACAATSVTEPYAGAVDRARAADLSSSVRVTRMRTVLR